MPLSMEDIRSTRRRSPAQRLFQIVWISSRGIAVFVIVVPYAKKRIDRSVLPTDGARPLLQKYDENLTGFGLTPPSFRLGGVVF